MKSTKLMCLTCCLIAASFMSSCSQDDDSYSPADNLQVESASIPNNDSADSVYVTMTVDSTEPSTRARTYVGNGVIYYKFPATRSPRITRQVGSLKEGREQLQGYFYPVEMNKRGGDKCIGRLFFKCTIFPRSLHLVFENVFDGKVIALHIFGDMSFLKSGKSFFTNASWIESYMAKGCQYGPYEIYHSHGYWILGLAGGIATDADGNSSERWKW